MHIRKKTAALFFLLICLLASMQVNAAQKNKWVVKNENYYYYDASGKPMSGLQSINGRAYYFDKRGVQHIGWQKIGKSYYYFRRTYGAKGYMDRNTKICKIRLSQDGKAVMTAYAKEKLPILIQANKIKERCTRPAWSKDRKLKAVWNYVMHNCKGGGLPEFELTKNWELKYARDGLFGGKGQCYAFGAAFAFLAYACGYDDCYAVSTGKHGWAKVGELVYDPSNQQWDGRRNNYYGRPVSVIPGSTNYYGEKYKKKI